MGSLQHRARAPFRYMLHSFTLVISIFTMDVTEIIDNDVEDVKPTTSKPAMSAVDRLTLKKRYRAQKRLSVMKNKVMRSAQWASLKKEKRKVKKIPRSCVKKKLKNSETKL